MHTINVSYFICNCFHNYNISLSIAIWVLQFHWYFSSSLIFLFSKAAFFNATLFKSWMHNYSGSRIISLSAYLSLFSSPYLLCQARTAHSPF